jgi:hypothetical protein
MIVAAVVERARERKILLTNTCCHRRQTSAAVLAWS